MILQNSLQPLSLLSFESVEVRYGRIHVLGESFEHLVEP